MRLEQSEILRELPRERLEELTYRALIDLQVLRREAIPNGYFLAVATGFLIGATVATGGFVIGALLR